MRYGYQALFQKFIKRMKRVDEPRQHQKAPKVYIHTEWTNTQCGTTLL